MTVPFLDVQAGQSELSMELRAAFDRVMESGQYVLGREVEQFEQDYATFCGSDYCIGVGNGLDALSIVLRSKGIGPGDEVIVPVHTFIATWLAVAQTGATIVPVDVDPRRLQLDADAAGAACTPATAAIIPVHLYGAAVDPRPLEELARRHGLVVVGDAAQAHGASFAGRPVGATFDAATYSFYPAKNLGAFGDGGAITTNDRALADSARRIRNYGSVRKYEFEESGVNSRLDELQAALLRVKLRVLDEWNSRRRFYAHRYLDELSGVPELVLPPRPTPGSIHVWHLFWVRHPQRDELKAHLESRGIQTQIHYPVPPHLGKAFEHLGYLRGSFPISESAAESLLSLPLGPHLDDGASVRVIEAIRTFRSA
jgi:dTDP-4-amino-4,6-dideoxygalactose transaminase